MSINSSFFLYLVQSLKATILLFDFVNLSLQGKQYNHHHVYLSVWNIPSKTRVMQELCQWLICFHIGSPKFIRVHLYCQITFFLEAEQYFIVCVCSIFFIHYLLVNFGLFLHLGCYEWCCSECMSLESLFQFWKWKHKTTETPI